MSVSSDDADDGINFEPPVGTEEMEFQVLDDGQEPPAAEPAEDPLKGKKVLSDEEYQELLKRQDSTGELSAGLGKLVEGLTRAPQQQPLNAPAPQGPSEEELEKMLFQPGQSAAAIRQILMRELAPIQGATIQQQQQTAKKLLKLDPKTSELYKTYEEEIERRVQALPPQVRFRADIYEAMYKEVLVDRQEEIIQNRAAAIAKQAVEEALKKAGIGAPAAEKPPALRQESGGGTPPKPKKVVYLTAADVTRMREMMLDPNDPDQKKAYYERYKKGGEK